MGARSLSPAFDRLLRMRSSLARIWPECGLRQGDEADEAHGGTVTRQSGRLMPTPADGMDAGTASQLIPGVLRTLSRRGWVGVGA